MTVMGIEYKSNTLNIIILDGSRSKHTIIPYSKHIKTDDYPYDHVKVSEVVATLKAAIDEHKITKIIYLKKNTSGNYTSSLHFFWDGILTYNFGNLLVRVHKRTLLATDKRLATNKINVSPKYLAMAYDLAFEGLN